MLNGSIFLASSLDAAIRINLLTFHLNCTLYFCCRRYYFSVFLELADITMPIVKTVVAKVSDAISFFLVSLIGRSLGLIYSGIKNSLRLI